MPRRSRPPTDSGSIPLPAGDETYLYRAYCQCGDLLYVGITSNLSSRLVDHKRGGAAYLRRMELDAKILGLRMSP